MYSKGFCKGFGELQCPGTLCRECEVECCMKERSKDGTIDDFLTDIL